MATQPRRPVATAYVDGRLYDARGWGGVRLTVRVPPHAPMSLLLEPGPTDAQTARLLAIEEALTVVKEAGARRVAVFCDDGAAVRIIRGEAHVEGDSLAPYLRVRALMNRFNRVAVVEASALPAQRVRRLLAGFGKASVRPLGQPRNLSLFPQLAA